MSGPETRQFPASDAGAVQVAPRRSVFAAPRRGWLRNLGLWVGGLAVLLVGVLIGSWWQQGSEDVEVTMSKADIAFAQDMSAHHAQALLIAQSLPREVDAQVRVVADQIITAQNAEIATLQGWLTLAEQPMTPPPTSASGHHDHGGQRDGHDLGANPSGPPMPGMASTTEITRLADARGTEAETLFLQLMIRHHTGGTAMARDAIQSGLSAPVERTALAMIRDQGSEVGVMSALLKARNAEQLAYP